MALNDTFISQGADADGLSANHAHDVVLVIIADKISTITLLMSLFLLIFDDSTALSLRNLL